MSDPIRPGTPCYLTQLSEYEFNGRVIEIAPGPVPSEQAGAWYRIDAMWLRELFGDREVHAERNHLRPIIPPERVADKQTSAPVTP